MSENHHKARIDQMTDEEARRLSPEALFRIGMTYIYGMDCEKNIEFGAKYLRFSAEKQYRPAALKLGKLGPKYSGNINTSGLKQNREKIDFMARYQSRKHILLVDDDKNILSLEKAMLEDLDVDLSFAETGKSALEMLQNYSFDLVIMDYMLPHANGLQLVTTMRQVLHISTPVMMVSGHGDKDTIEGALKMGIVSWTTKPIDPNFFVDMVKRNIFVVEKKPK